MQAFTEQTIPLEATQRLDAEFIYEINCFLEMIIIMYYIVDN